MHDLTSMLRMVREARGMRQSDVARILGISHSAVTRFERKKTTLSTRRVKEFAEAIGIASAFVDAQTMNPFGIHKERVIRLLIPEERGTERLHFELLMDLSTSGPDTAAFLVEAPLSKRAENNRGRSGSSPLHRAAIVRDVDHNLFLFRPKEKRRFFSGFDVMRTLEAIAIERKMFVQISSVKVSEQFHAKIDDPDCALLKNDVLSQIEGGIRRPDDDRRLMMDIINKMGLYRLFSEDSEYRQVRERAESMGEREFAEFLRAFLGTGATFCKFWPGS